MLNNTTRRHPRSTREAFPVERAQAFEHPVSKPPLWKRLLQGVALALLAVAIIGALVGSMPLPG